jgi:hypothetical protein
MKAPDDHAAVLGQLDPHEKNIREDEGRSIKSRCDFGKVLLKQRGDKKQLPRGLRSRITEQFGLEASEITRRMQLADTFKTEKQLMDVRTRCGDSWRRIIREELPKTPRKEKAEPSWAELKKAALNRWLREASGDDGHHAELKQLVGEAARALGWDVREPEAEK